MHLLRASRYEEEREIYIYRGRERGVSLCVPFKIIEKGGKRNPKIHRFYDFY